MSINDASRNQVQSNLEVLLQTVASCVTCGIT